MPRPSSVKTRSPATLHLTSELVARSFRVVEEEGPEPDWTPISPEQLDELVQRVEKQAGEEEIWIFAYGSLMWNPGFEVAGMENAVVHGWHRAFSLRIERLRATSDAPGLMLALQPGEAVPAWFSSFHVLQRNEISGTFWRAKSGMLRCLTWYVGSRSRRRRAPVGY